MASNGSKAPRGAKQSPFLGRTVSPADGPILYHRYASLTEILKDPSKEEAVLRRLQDLNVAIHPQRLPGKLPANNTQAQPQVGIVNGRQTRLERGVQSRGGSEADVPDAQQPVQPSAGNQGKQVNKRKDKKRKSAAPADQDVTNVPGTQTTELTDVTAEETPTKMKKSKVAGDLAALQEQQVAGGDDDHPPSDEPQTANQPAGEAPRKKKRSKKAKNTAGGEAGGEAGEAPEATLRKYGADTAVLGAERDTTGSNPREAANMRQHLGVRGKEFRGEDFAFRFAGTGGQPEPASDTWQPEGAEPAPREPPTGQDAAPKLASASQQRRVYAGGLPYYFTENQVRELFAECGDVEHVHCMTFPDTGKFRGIAFVTLGSDAAAAAALAMDGGYVDECSLVVKPAKANAKDRKTAAGKPAGSGGAEKPGAVGSREAGGKQEAAAGTGQREAAKKVDGYNVAYVANLAYELGPDAVKEVFSDMTVERVRLHTDKSTGRSRGFAHVHFKDEASLDKAIALNGMTLFGRQLKVAYAQPSKS